MRIFILIILAVTTCFCTTPRNTIDQEDFYIVTRIDSVGNFFLIYAIRNDSIFEIASKKTKVVDCDQLKVDKKYFFKLRSRIFTGEIDGGKIADVTNDLVKCIGLDRETTVCFDDNCVQDLFYTENIEGLCYRSR